MDGKDTFRFMFADKDDIYFTSHLLKYDFERYLNYIWKKRRYEGVFFFDTIATDSEKMRIACEDSATKRSYEEHTNKGIFGSRINIFEEMFYDRKRFYIEQKKEFVRDTIEKLMGQRDKKYVFVFSNNTFSKLYPNESLIENLANMIHQGNARSLFLIVESKGYQGDLIEIPGIATADERRIVKWETFEVRQIERILQRVNVSLGQQSIDMEELIKHLHHNFKENMDYKLFGIQVRDKRNKKDLFESILFGESVAHIRNR